MTVEERKLLEGELRCLYSDIKYDKQYGDYKITKCKEYELLGLDCPYTKEVLEDYHNKRNEIRDRINEIETLLSKEE